MSPFNSQFETPLGALYESPLGALGSGEQVVALFCVLDESTPYVADGVWPSALEEFDEAVGRISTLHPAWVVKGHVVAVSPAEIYPAGELDALKERFGITLSDRPPTVAELTDPFDEMIAGESLAYVFLGYDQSGSMSYLDDIPTGYKANWDSFRFHVREVSGLPPLRRFDEPIIPSEEWVSWFAAKLNQID